MQTQAPPRLVGQIGQGGYFVYGGQRLSVEQLRQQHPQQYTSFLEQAIGGAPRGSSEQRLAQSWEGAIEDANVATMRDRGKVLRSIRQDKRTTAAGYADIGRMLAGRTEGVRQGYAAAGAQLSGARDAALGDIERGRSGVDRPPSSASWAGGAAGVAEAGQRRADEAAGRSAGAVRSGYAQQAAGMTVRGARAVADADDAETSAIRELGEIGRSLGQERRGVLERTQREVPGYGEIANLYADAASESAAKKAASSAKRAAIAGAAVGIFASFI